MLINHMKENHPRYYRCKECDMRFNQSSELETHIVTEHNVKKKHKCEICNTEFVFKWRLNRHFEDHKKVIRKCHFFNNNVTCPYTKIGCKFSHEIVDICKYTKKIYKDKVTVQT